MILGIPAGCDLFVAPVDQQPFLAPVGTEIGTDEDEPPVELHPLQVDLELAPLERGRGIRHRSVGPPAAPVPHDDVTRAVLRARDHPFEGEVFERVVLDTDGETANGGVE